MAETVSNRSVDPETGFSRQSGTYSCLRPPIPLPPINQPLSVAEFCLSVFHSTSTDGATTFIVNATTGETLSYSEFVSQVRFLAYSLQQRYSLCQNDVAFVLSPPSVHIPVVYLALLSLGIVVSPANPLSSNSELAHQIQLSKPVVAFATSQTSHKIPSLKHGTIILDSPEFLSLLTQSNINDDVFKRVKVNQSDTAAILYSSGTTGRVKGVMVTHRNLIAMMAMIHNINTNEAEGNEKPPRSVTFFTVPLFHVFGFFMLLGAVVSANTVVFLERFDFKEMLRAVEKYKVTGMPVSPPLVVAFVKSDLTKKYDLRSLQGLGCGGAPLGKDISQRFKEKFPNVLLIQQTENSLPIAETDTKQRRAVVDPNTGFCSQTKTFHSIRPSVPLPPPSQPLSLPHYALSLLRTSPAGDTTFIVDATNDQSLSYSQFIAQVRSLAYSLKKNYSLSQNDVAFILSPPSFHVPLLYFALMALGIVVSPSNPLSSESEIAHQVRLSKPVIAFATSKTSSKLPSLKLGTVILDSPKFQSFLTQPNVDAAVFDSVKVSQHDTAAILYSSGTTGRVKGVKLSHRNIIALIAGYYHIRAPEQADEPHPVSFFTVPFFHVFGFFMLARVFSLGETMVFTDRFEFVAMLRAIEKYKVTFMPVSPPLVVAFIKLDLTKKYDLSSLLLLGSGGAPLGKEVAERFKEKFPTVELVQGYGLTETAGGATRVVGPEEAARYGTVGRLGENMEAKIVDPETGEAQPPGQRGELWLRGPTVMKGYVGDEKATAETLDSEGWLKTGDICYFDSQGFIYIVDRLKELIKYKAYQVPPAELEHLLLSHPEIADAAVIPYPDEEAGQIPMAYVVRNPGSSITEAGVMEFIAKQVAPYKKIRRVAFINSIPKSPAGKILRRELVTHSLSAGKSKL
ncbi:hypothetical protein V6N11_064717 [Hibiscus sabdariffa]|uniref:4-coumarate--CoA ligase n=1 Tax=Hibiscus sabdariffa TaxID=183260 RepID=A0ABR2NBC9_9ROSI